MRFHQTYLLPGKAHGDARKDLRVHPDCFKRVVRHHTRESPHVDVVRSHGFLNEKIGRRRPQNLASPVPKTNWATEQGLVCGQVTSCGFNQQVAIVHNRCSSSLSGVSCSNFLETVKKIWNLSELEASSGASTSPSTVCTCETTQIRLFDKKFGQHSNIVSIV